MTDPLHRIQAIYTAALDLSPDQRGPLLEEECGGDEALRDEVESLLGAADQLGGFLEGAAVGTAPTPDAGPAAGDRVGPYQLIQKIASGGMGTVWLAERADAEYEKQVAIKLVKRGMDSDDLLHRFRNERQLLASLDHTRIARLLDGGATESGAPYLVMEFVEGEPIDAYCAARDLDLEGRLEIFGQVLEAVHFAHQKLVLHRDLKPGNIVVTSDGGVKLLDFGIARLLPETGTLATGDLTAPSERLLTPRYASPEQIRGDALSTASDVYSLGVILYELLTGRTPYRVVSRSREHYERAVCEQDPLRPSASVTGGDATTLEETTWTGSGPNWTTAGTRRLQRRLRGDLDNIVLKALRKDPGRRYSTAFELHEDLRRHLRGLPVMARADTWSYRASRFVGRNRALVASLLLVFTSLVGGVVIATVALSKERAARREVTEKRALAEESLAFLERMLGGIDPRVAKGRDHSLLLALAEAAAAQVDEELADVPEAAARIHRVLGALYLTLARGLEGERHALSAWTLFRDLHGAEDPRAIRSLRLLGALKVEAGAHEAGEEHLTLAVELAEEFLGPADPLLSQCLNSLAHLDSIRDRHLSALARYERVIEITRDDAPLDRALYLHNYGVALERAGRYGEARTALEEALQIRQELLGPNHYDLMFMYGAMGNLLGALGESDEAVENWEQALSIARDVLEPDHSYLASTLQGLAAAFLRIRRTAEAIALYRESLQILESAHAGAHPWLAQNLSNLSVALMRTRSYEEAEELQRRALAMRRELYPDGHSEVATSLDSLAGILTETGRLSEAPPLYDEALEIRRQVLGPAHPLLAVTLHNSSFLLFRLKRYEEAEIQSREALEIRVAALPPEHPSTALNHFVLGRILLGGAKPEPAAVEFASAAGIYAVAYGPEHQYTLRSTVFRGKALTDAGRVAEAEELLRVASSKLAERLGEEHSWVREARNALAALEESTQPAAGARD